MVTAAAKQPYKSQVMFVDEHSTSTWFAEAGDGEVNNKEQEYNYRKGWDKEFKNVLVKPFN